MSWTGIWERVPNHLERLGRAFSSYLAGLLAAFLIAAAVAAYQPLRAQGGLAASGAPAPTTAGGDKSNLDSLGLTEAERAWLNAHKRIRIGIDGGYAPYSFVGQKGEFIGAAPDFLTRVSVITGLTFEAVPNLSWPEIVDGARQRTLDVIATAVKTPERDAFLDFTEIYIPTPLMITTRKAESGIRTPADLAGRKIALVRGYSSSERVLREHPDIRPLMVEDPLEGLRMVAGGEADGYVGVLGVNVHLATKYGLANLKQAVRYDLVTNGQRFGVRKDWPELASILDKALARISIRERNAILAFWVPVSMDNLDLPVFELTGEEKLWLARHHEIKVGVMDAWPPLDYVDATGQARGIGAEFVRALNNRLGGALKLYAGPWANNLQAAKEKRLDVIMDITPRAGREPFLNFTKPYVTVPHVIFARVGAPNYKTLSDLDGLAVGVERGFFIADVMREKYPGIKVKVFNSTADALDAVAKSEVDAYVGNRAVAMYIIRNELIANLQEYGKVEETASVNAIGVRKDWPILHGILQKALASVTVKERNAILKDWISPNAGRESSNLTLTSLEWAWLSDHPVIRVAGDRNWPPVDFVGANGQFQGLAVDYLDRLSQMLGVRFEFDLVSDWATAARKLKERKLDLFSAAAPTDDRREFVNFTTPYLKLPAVIFADEDTPYINGTAGLKGKRVAVVRGYAVSEFLRKNDPGVTLVEVSDVVAGLNKIRSGDADAYVGSILATSYAIRKYNLDTIRAVGQTPYGIDIAMAARSDWPIFHSILQKALDAITERERAAMESKWIGVQIASAPDYALIWQVAAAAGLTLVLFFFWNWYLQGKTVRQEADLKKINEALLIEVDERRAAQSKAMAASQAKSEMLANMSHELRTPLNAIIGYADMMVMNVGAEKLNESHRDWVKSIHIAGDHLLKLVDSLLDLSAVESGEVRLNEKQVNVADLIQTVRTMVEPRADQAKVRVVWPVLENLPDILVDPQRFRQVVINLLDNAIKFSPSGAAVELSCAIDDAGRFSLSIHDDGPGIPPEQIPGLMDPFKRGRGAFVREREGAGLGLAIVDRYTKLHDGTFDLVSRPGEGATAIVTLPRQRVFVAKAI